MPVEAPRVALARRARTGSVPRSGPRAPRWLRWWRTSDEVGTPSATISSGPGRRSRLHRLQRTGDEDGFFWSDRAAQGERASPSPRRGRSGRPLLRRSATSCLVGSGGSRGRPQPAKAGFEDHLVGGLRLGGWAAGGFELAMVVTIEDAMRGDDSASPGVSRRSPVRGRRGTFALPGRRPLQGGPQDRRGAAGWRSASSSVSARARGRMATCSSSTSASPGRVKN